MQTYAAYLLILGLAAAALLVARRMRLPEIAQWAILALAAAVMAAFMWQVSEPQDYLADFENAYYYAGDQITKDADALYDESDPTRGFTNIPIVAWLFVPLAQLDFDAAGVIMTATGVAAIVAAFALTLRVTGATGWQAMAIGGLYAACGPLYNSLREGNTTHLVLFALVAAVWCLQQRRDVALGMLLAFAAIIKPPLALLIVPFLLRRNWAAVGGFAGTVSLIAALSLAIYGWDLHRQWYDVTVQPFTEHPLGAFNVQSFDGFLARVRVGDEYFQEWTPIESLGMGYRAVRTLLIAATAIVSLVVLWRWRSWSQVADERLELCAALVLALLVTPISWSHYYLLLLLPLSLLIAGTLPMPRTAPWYAAFGACALLICSPVIVANTEQRGIGELYARVLASYEFIGGALLLALLLALRYRATEQRSTATQPVSHATVATAND